jgi:hypothetical protein
MLCDCWFSPDRSMISFLREAVSAVEPVPFCWLAVMATCPDMSLLLLASVVSPLRGVSSPLSLWVEKMAKLLLVGIVLAPAALILELLLGLVVLLVARLEPLPLPPLLLLPAREPPRALAPVERGVLFEGGGIPLLSPFTRFPCCKTEVPLFRFPLFCCFCCVCCWRCCCCCCCCCSCCCCL